MSHDALYKENANDLVLYPSVASNSHYCNFAIHPNIVDQYLTFKKVIRFEVVEVNSDLSLVLKTGRVGEVINNSIVWRKGDEAEVDFNNLP
ncbi:MAG TPA: hypothetical protein VNI52_13100 [Sphingobacteriaceae bacterium]|nr:hypothetical protein [Sphingobacteriaceae bacterium]